MSDEDDDNVLFGTKFTNHTTQGKIKHVQDEIVTDEKGRRRFHGAFTGGFSAGYFNSVGSKEGFTPATFISSKNQRQVISSESADKFMDDEDISAFGIAPKNIGKSSEYNEETANSEDSIMSIMSVNRDSKGIQLMKAMGWKSGFGVGPRKQVEKKAEKCVYSCQLPPGYEEEEEDAEEDMYTIGLFMAPKDTAQHSLQPHTSTQGIDYSGLSGDKPSSSSSNTPAVAGFSGEAFGVGALEEAEEFSVYNTDDKTNYTTTVEDEADSSAWDVHISHKFNTTKDKYLSNFTLGKSDKYLRKTYPPPALPGGFKPWHVPDTTSSPQDKVKPASSVLERAVKLGITDFDKLAPDSPQSAASPSDPANPAAAATPKQEEVSESDKKPASTASLFRPFKSNPGKEDRYNTFVAGEAIDYSSVNMTDWEQERERDEFAKSSKFFKPLSWEMANRFTTAGNNVEEEERKSLENQAENERKEAVRMKMFGQLTRETHQWVPASLTCKRFDVLNPYPDIQSVGTIRRFNRVVTTKHSQVPEAPASSTQHPDNKVSREDPSTSTADTTAADTTTADISGGNDTKVEGDTATSDTATIEDDRKLEDKINDNIDLFKSVFADSSDEDSETEESTDNATLAEVSSVKIEAQDDNKADDITETTTQETPNQPSDITLGIKSEIKIEIIDMEAPEEEEFAKKEIKVEPLPPTASDPTPGIKIPVFTSLPDNPFPSTISPSSDIFSASLQPHFPSTSEFLTPVIVPLPPMFATLGTTQPSPIAVASQPGIVFNSSRYKNPDETSVEPTNIDKDLLEKLRSIPDQPIKKKKKKREKKLKKEKKEKKKKKKKKKHRKRSSSSATDRSIKSRSRSRSATRSNSGKSTPGRDASKGRSSSKDKQSSVHEKDARHISSASKSRSRSKDRQSLSDYKDRRRTRSKSQSRSRSKERPSSSFYKESRQSQSISKSRSCSKEKENVSRYKDKRHSRSSSREQRRPRSSSKDRIKRSSDSKSFRRSRSRSRSKEKKRSRSRSRDRQNSSKYSRSDSYNRRSYSRESPKSTKRRNSRRSRSPSRSKTRSRSRSEPREVFCRKSQSHEVYMKSNTRSTGDRDSNSVRSPAGNNRRDSGGNREDFKHRDGDRGRGRGGSNRNWDRRPSGEGKRDGNNRPSAVSRLGRRLTAPPDEITRTLEQANKVQQQKQQPPPPPPHQPPPQQRLNKSRLQSYQPSFLSPVQTNSQGASYNRNQGAPRNQGPYQGPQVQQNQTPNFGQQTHHQRALPSDWQQPQQVIETEIAKCESTDVSKTSTNSQGASDSFSQNIPEPPKLSSAKSAVKEKPQSSGTALEQAKSPVSSDTIPAAPSSAKRKKEPEKKANFVPKRARAIDLCDI